MATNKNAKSQKKEKKFLGLNITQGRIGDRIALAQRVRLSDEKRQRNSEIVQKRILDQPRFRGLQNGTDFFDLLKTTLGNSISPDGLSRPLEPQDLRILAKRAQSLQGKYRGGILPTQVINASLSIDRRRASTEIPWAHPTKATFVPMKKSLVITFITAASGKYPIGSGRSDEARMHFVDVELMDFNQITQHWLMPENPKEQAKEDVKALYNTPIKFNCDCGRHTFWYRFIATAGDFAYIGTNPLGRPEGGFPKIRNPALKGIACKHVIRVMQTMLNNLSYNAFLEKACLKQYKVGNSEKRTSTQTTRKELEKSINAQLKQHDDDQEILSDKEKRINKRLLNRFKQALDLGILQRSPRDKRSPKQKLAELAKFHNVDKYSDLIK